MVGEVEAGGDGGEKEIIAIKPCFGIYISFLCLPVVVKTCSYDNLTVRSDYG